MTRAEPGGRTQPGGRAEPAEPGGRAEPAEPGGRGRPTAAPEILLAGTRLRPVALVPEIWLRQADEPIALWEATEEAASQAGQDADQTAGQAAGQAGQAAARAGHATGRAAQATGQAADQAAGRAGLATGHTAGRAGQATWQAADQAAGRAGLATGHTAGRAAGRAGLEPPFWAFAWAGGQALARYLLDHREAARGQTVIDVASGSGLVAIAAAMAGAADVTAYDIDPLAAAAIGVNAAANRVTVRAICADVLDDDALPAPGTDLVLAADAFYQRELATRVFSFLDRGRARGAAVLAGDLGRVYLPRDRLTPLASYDVPGLGALEDTDVKRSTIWTLCAPRPA